jgi:hypothetical protein
LRAERAHVSCHPTRKARARPQASPQPQGTRGHTLTQTQSRGRAHTHACLSQLQLGNPQTLLLDRWLCACQLQGELDEPRGLSVATQGHYHGEQGRGDCAGQAGRLGVVSVPCACVMAVVMTLRAPKAFFVSAAVWALRSAKRDSDGKPRQGLWAVCRAREEGQCVRTRDRRGTEFSYNGPVRIGAASSLVSPSRCRGLQAKEKFSPELEAEACAWITALTGIPVSLGCVLCVVLLEHCG